MIVQHKKGNFRKEERQTWIDIQKICDLELSGEEAVKYKSAIRAEIQELFIFCIFILNASSWPAKGGWVYSQGRNSANFISSSYRSKFFSLRAGPFLKGFCHQGKNTGSHKMGQNMVVYS